MSEYTRILVAVDLSEDSGPVAQRAMAVANNAELHFIHVIEPLSFAYGGDIPMDFSGIQDEIQQQATQQLQRFSETHAIDAAHQHIVLGRPEVEIHAKAEELGLQPLVRFVGYAVGGVAPELMGIGPTVAVPKVLTLTGLSLEDIELIELNEAFAAQSLAVIRELGLDQEITNVNGGAIALGHPLGCTGAKLTTQLIYEMKRRNVQFGMVTMCIGGGMGMAMIVER